MFSTLQVHPEIREDVKALIPPPDLAAIEERLNQLKRNIYKVFFQFFISRSMLSADLDFLPNLNPAPGNHKILKRNFRYTCGQCCGSGSVCF
jgi:hypothetical protein